ncbi:NAD(P)-dependent alcohol dehydrogenase [uncultured Microbacterium sp.]|uniref:NAD(P)-dependent alcohol dehydrogenase n=1 Tax=uncultured Microbacterium sp. TaxID=191216 RepID=UPI0028D7DF61|nr:NAD(P)-dependent alcohol dehydrogenase [uncultured Microbacterium sp.]
MSRNIGYATPDKNTPLAPFTFDRREVGPEDVRIDIAYCGVCHSDVHQARDEFGGALATLWPCLPGHEIAGTVAEVGSQVTRYAVGDRVGVGCLVYWGDESQRGVSEEQYQNPPAIFTYNGQDPDAGDVTLGGYSDEIVVNEHFVLRIPDAIPLEQAAPLLCAGVTTWSPLAHWNIGPGSVVAVAGLGGLGHLAVQLAKARGADRVIALTTSPDKADAVRALGADDVIDMTDEDAVEAQASSIDFVLSTIPTPFDMKPYLSLIRHDGALVTVGMLEPIHEEGIDFGFVSMNRITIAGSLIGSIAETQEVLDFAAEHGIAAEVKVIPVQQVNEAFDEMVANDIRFRFVIDSSTLDADRDSAAELPASQ